MNCGEPHGGDCGRAWSVIDMLRLLEEETEDQVFKAIDAFANDRTDRVIGRRGHQVPRETVRLWLDLRAEIRVTEEEKSVRSE